MRDLNKPVLKGTYVIPAVASGLCPHPIADTDLMFRGHDIYVPASAAEVDYMKAAAARHKNPSASTTAIQPGNLALVTFEPPAKSFVELLKAALPMGNMAKLNPPQVLGALQEALASPCAKLLGNDTALQVRCACEQWMKKLTGASKWCQYTDRG